MGIKKQTRRLFKAREKAAKRAEKLTETTTKVTSLPHLGGSKYFPTAPEANLSISEENKALRVASKGSKALKVDTRPVSKRVAQRTDDGN